MRKLLIHIVGLIAIAFIASSCSNKARDAAAPKPEDAAPAEQAAAGSGICKMREGNSDDKYQYVISKMNQLDDKISGNDLASLESELSAFDTYLADKGQKLGAIMGHLDSLRIKIVNFETKSCAGFSEDDYYSPKDADIYKDKLVELGYEKEWREWLDSLGALKSYDEWKKAVDGKIKAKTTVKKQ
jgi:hypothetical protein